MKYILFISMLIFLGCRTTRNIETDYALRGINPKLLKVVKFDTLSNDITGLQSGTYVYQFNPYLYTSFPEPVSMLPLAIAIVLGIGLIIGVSARLYEFIKTGK